MSAFYRRISPGLSGRALSEFCAAMQRRGFYVTGHVWFLCLAHTDEDVEEIIAAAADAVEEASAALESAQRAAAGSDTPQPRKA